MRRRDVIGLPVVTAEGERLGDVEELLVNRSGRKVIGLLLSGGNALQGRRVYPYEEVRAIGDGAVVVSQRRAVLRTRRSARLNRLAADRGDLVGRRLLSPGGDDLGMIADLVFDPGTGRVLGYDLTGGFIRDVTEGRRFLPVAVEWVIGRDAVICPDAASRQEE